MPHLTTLVAAGLLLALAGCGQDAPTPPEPPTRIVEGAGPSASRIQEQWEFYPARIDGQDATMMIDLGYRSVAPLADTPVLLWVNVTMPDPGEGGQGSPATAKQLGALEDSLTADLHKALGARLVARIRGKGKWQMRFYAPWGAKFEATVRAAIQKISDLTFDTGSDPDPEWLYYLDFLCPDEERSQWIKDRRVMNQLKKSGDVLTTPRPVDHWLYFKTAAGREKFEASIAELGFRVRARDKVAEGTPARPFSLNVERTDKVDLESIHRVVVRLMEAARAVDGAYDGWGCEVIRSGDGG